MHLKLRGRSATKVKRRASSGLSPWIFCAE